MSRPSDAYVSFYVERQLQAGRGGGEIPAKDRRRPCLAKLIIFSRPQYRRDKTGDLSRVHPDLHG